MVGLVGLGKRLPSLAPPPRLSRLGFPLWLSYWVCCCISFCLLSQLPPSVTQTPHTFALEAEAVCEPLGHLCGTFRVQDTATSRFFVPGTGMGVGQGWGGI